ncbi:uncharacterized protein LOC142334841 [Convolutriloba macropyga]|uniref:uncharacterized protein LOC142334841 n=1 Tax=Convolutriloba macropyga TaxID=536237 RepID=UPI003F52128F
MQRLACAITCSKNGKCVSFNYCDRGMCHLNAMTINDDFVLSVVKRNEECVYAGRRDSCVRSDPSYEICSGCFKRSDSYHWSPLAMTAFEQENVDWFTVGSNRSCLDIEGNVTSNANCPGE